MKSFVVLLCVGVYIRAQWQFSLDHLCAFFADVLGYFVLVLSVEVESCSFKTCMGNSIDWLLG